MALPQGDAPREQDGVLQGQPQEERSTGHHRGNQRSSSKAGEQDRTAGAAHSQEAAEHPQHRCGAPRAQWPSCSYPSATGILAGQGTQHTASSWAWSLELAEKATLVPKMIHPVGHFPKGHKGKAGVLHTPMWIRAGGELQNKTAQLWDSICQGRKRESYSKKKKINVFVMGWGESTTCKSQSCPFCCGFWSMHP